MSPKRVSDTATQLIHVMTPNEANLLGKVFGGALLAQIDLCAYATASKFAGNVCVTAAFDQVDFHEPIEVGEIVTLEGHVTYVGRTSMEITIGVSATDVIPNRTRRTNTARVTMVAMHDGAPVEVPRLLCETDDEKRLFLLGKVRRERVDLHRKGLRDVEAALARADTNLLDQVLAGEESIDAILFAEPS